MCADCETGMTLNLQMYCGKCGGKENNQGFRVVRDMVLPMLSRGNKFTVVCDNFFCMLRLSHYLASCRLIGKNFLMKQRPSNGELPIPPSFSRKESVNISLTTTKKEACFGLVNLPRKE
ncbi:hypothetical protein EIN_014110 [Entamoeba invadens IP1]|uniref:PiggyBac transposable element-derived protein domain-containing protein n=1 Tax=Entamoeba invadens IP1 TaxID=370355 RepID=L7FK79_ENTIV|nr:hypothetical protein EIN_014110 [Entamoeba invadens IP1]ELP86298.1 hypothetical protein EIN_014110 [Entamoeba invadens IP1]|eukprot:XP_004185644.1 hypothetical protein EIN_014110 [Entamoeba invadens IP1]